MKKIFVVAGTVILLAVVGRGYWAYQQVRYSNKELVTAPTDVLNSPTSQQESTTIEDKTIAPVQKINSSNTYTNQKYGFTLQIPKAWEGYLVSIDEGKIVVMGEKPTVINFNLKKESAQTSFVPPVLMIWVFDKAGWVQLTTEYKFEEVQNGGPLPTKIGESAMYVFAHSEVKSNDVQKVIDSFLLTKQPGTGLRLCNQDELIAGIAGCDPELR